MIHLNILKKLKNSLAEFDLSLADLVKVNVWLKNIEDVRVGDLVLSYDEETGSNVPGKVTAVLSHIQPGYYIIDDNLQITPTNPIWANDLDHHAF